MKKQCIIGMMLVSGCTLALAQSNVVIYGVVDAALVNERGGVAGASTKLSSGVGATSRLGFRGSEDLGGGVSAHFVLESGVKVDSGDIDAAGTLFNRQALVGLKSGMGAITLGRQYTPLYTTISTVADPFGAGYAGSAKNLLPTAGSLTRTSNTLMLASPTMSGFSGELAYSLGEQAGSNVAGRQIGAALAYSEGALNMRLALNYRNNDITAAAGAASVPPVAASNKDIGRNTLLAANYNLGVAKVYGAFGIDKGTNSAPLPNTGNPYGGVKPTASTDSRDLLVGVSVPFGSSTVLASFSRKDDKTRLDQDASQWAVGVTCALSKRTILYTSYAYIANKNGAGYTVGNSAEAGSGNRAFNAGVRHSF